MSINYYEKACFLNKAQYLWGDPVELSIPHWEQSCENPNIQVRRLHKPVKCMFDCKQNGDVLIIIITGLACGNYGIRVEAVGDPASGVEKPASEVKLSADEGDSLPVGQNRLMFAETAFDIVAKAAEVTRYGFLTDFAPADNHTDDVASMRRLHLNAVQFYDWMYRHDELVAPTEEYEDALGKTTSRRTICTKTAACKQMGMRPFAYGAVYAATPGFSAAHPDWELRTSSGEPLMFGDGWLHFMNIAPGSAWSVHLLAEYERTVTDLGFMGIHMDTYGFPKYANDTGARPVSLRNCFAPLINAAAARVRALDENNGVIFNAVNNWPIEQVAGSDQDAVYIEVWPPHESYFDLYRLIREARLLSGGKTVVLAAYMEPFKHIESDGAGRANEAEPAKDAGRANEADPVKDAGRTAEAMSAKAEYAYLLTNAVINASGGTQLALGADDGILCDSYYPNHARLSPEFVIKTQKYADFLVRYAELLYADPGSDISMSCTGGINQDIIFRANDVRFSSHAAAGAVWTIIRESEARICVNLVNLCGNGERWNEKKNKPIPADNIRIAFRLDHEIEGIYWASPDGATLAAQRLEHTFEDTHEGRIYRAVLPVVNIWTSVWLEFA